MQETSEAQFRSLGWEDPLEEGMATRSSILSWRIPMDRGARRARVHGVSKSKTWLSTQHSFYSAVPFKEGWKRGMILKGNVQEMSCNRIQEFGDLFCWCLYYSKWWMSLCLSFWRMGHCLLQNRLVGHSIETFIQGNLCMCFLHSILRFSFKISY